MAHYLFFYHTKEQARKAFDRLKARKVENEENTETRFAAQFVTCVRYVSLTGTGNKILVESIGRGVMGRDVRRFLAGLDPAPYSYSAS